MQKLQVVGSVLYIVAHPDDENSSHLWLANGRKVRTGNPEPDRGDGGPEPDRLSSATRSASSAPRAAGARRIDGGEQFFTRAVDFGYSKSAERKQRNGANRKC